MDRAHIVADEDKGKRASMEHISRILPHAMASLIMPSFRRLSPEEQRRFIDEWRVRHG